MVGVQMKMGLIIGLVGIHGAHTGVNTDSSELFVVVPTILLAATGLNLTYLSINYNKLLYAYHFMRNHSLILFCFLNRCHSDYLRSS
jgi:hypothetical protein